MIEIIADLTIHISLSKLCGVLTKRLIMNDCTIIFLYSDLTTEELYALLYFNKCLKHKVQNKYKQQEIQRRIEMIIDIIDFRDDLTE